MSFGVVMSAEEVILWLIMMLGGMLLLMMSESTLTLSLKDLSPWQVLIYANLQVFLNKKYYALG